MLVVPRVSYAGLVDAMFHMIRQNARGSVAVLVRLLEVLTAVASVEHAPERLETLRRHADLALADATESVKNIADLSDVRSRHRAFVRMTEQGVMGRFADGAA